MRFNVGRLNTAPMNRAYIESDEIRVATVLSAVLDGFVTRGTNIYERQQLGAVLGTWAAGARGVLAGANLGAALYAGPRLSLRRFVAARLDAALGQAAYGTADVRVSDATLGAALLSGSLPGKDLYAAGKMHGAIKAGVLGGKDLYLYAVRMSASLDATASTILFAFADIRIDADIPPGSTLVIDAGGYAVLLDGENAMHAHSGDWPVFNRTTYDVQLTTLDGLPLTSADVNKRVLYVERYL